MTDIEPEITYPLIEIFLDMYAHPVVLISILYVSICLVFLVFYAWLSRYVILKRIWISIDRVFYWMIDMIFGEPYERN